MSSTDFIQNALVGGEICQYSAEVNARVAVPVIITSYIVCVRPTYSSSNM